MSCSSTRMPGKEAVKRPFEDIADDGSERLQDFCGIIAARRHYRVCGIEELRDTLLDSFLYAAPTSEAVNQALTNDKLFYIGLLVSSLDDELMCSGLPAPTSHRNRCNLKLEMGLRESFATTKPKAFEVQYISSSAICRANFC